MTSPSLNVLVVDDDPAVRMIARMVLGKAGYQVLEAEGGEQAMAHLASVGADLRVVLLDYSMPGRDGREVFADMVAAGCTAPVVICTGHEFDMNDFRTADGHMPTQLLKKPYDFPTLLAVVETAGAATLQ
jgi:CheY-like chemotaxis protein